MADPAQLAKAAREQLAAALNALQTSDDTPEALLEAAEPIAQSMGILHRIERSNGTNLDGREVVLSGVRAALDRIQQVDSDHPAVELVMSAVAASLAKVHSLVRYTPPAPAPVAAPAPPIQPMPVVQVHAAPPVAAAPAPAPHVAASPTPVAPTQAAPQAERARQPVAAPPAPAPAPVVPPATQKPNVTIGIDPRQPIVSPAASAHRAEPPPPAAAQIESAAFPLVQPAARVGIATQPSQPSSVVAVDRPVAPVVVERSRMPTPLQSPQAKAAGPSVDAELGTHSVSNFYKGLGGNDVIEHGGIFVATYKVPKLGAVVALHVTLPGDYEFHATAVVQWTRDAGTSEPGFGARFTQITPEGKQLVYRYTRNREPMFYDDL